MISLHSNQDPTNIDFLTAGLNLNMMQPRKAKLKIKKDCNKHYFVIRSGE
nr:MAG TPA: hypothetical protein [Caudoviricetes sp.]